VHRSGERAWPAATGSRFKGGHVRRMEEVGESEGGGHSGVVSGGSGVGQHGRVAGSARHRTSRLTGGPGRDGGPIVSGWVRGEAARRAGRCSADKWGR
jgi:hypothetical protein